MSAGIAARIGIDVLIVRGILVVVAILGGPAVLLYALAWLVLPDAHDRIHLEDLMHGKIESPTIAIGILIAIAVLPFSQGFWWFGSGYWGGQNPGDIVGRVIWTLIVLAAIIWLIVWFVRRTPSGAQPFAVPATTDDRPDTVPAPTVPPAAPATNATPDELAVWRERQTAWRTENEAYRRRQAAERQARSEADVAEARRQRMARTAEARRVRALTTAHPVYSIVVFVLAIGSGAAVMFAAGPVGAMNVLAGIAVAAGVFGIGTIVNGIRGKRGGAGGRWALLLLVPLILAGVFPQSPSLSYSGDASFTPHGTVGSSSSLVSGFGDTTVDLTEFYPTTRPTTPGLGTNEPSYVHLYVARGDVTVYVPVGEYVTVSTRIGSGRVTSHHKLDGVDEVSHSAVTHYFNGTDSSWSNVTRSIYLVVNVGDGNVNIVQAPSEMGINQ